MLRKVWLNIRVKKLDTYEGVTIKALLNSGTTGIFMDKRIAARYGLKLQKLERPIAVKNVDETNNSGGVIIYQIEVNVYYKNHIERMRTEIILGMLWLAAHNPEINWETGEVKIMRCSPLYSRVKSKEEEKKKRKKRVTTLKEEKIVRWVIDDKENWGREKEIEEDHKKIKEIVPRKFLKWSQREC